MLIHHVAPVDGADLIIRTTRAALPRLLAGKSDGMTLDGDVTALARLASVLEAPGPDFAIVTP